MKKSEINLLLVAYDVWHMEKWGSYDSTAHEEKLKADIAKDLKRNKTYAKYVRRKLAPYLILTAA